MDFFQFIGYIRQFNADVAIIGAAVWGLNLLLRKTLLKNIRQKKILTFLPFLLGILLYSAYSAAVGGSPADWCAMFNAGVTCGSLATVIEVAYEKFLLGDDTKNVRAACVKALLSDYGILDDERAEQIASAAGEDKDKTTALLAEICGQDMAETLYPLLCRMLDSLNNT